jgi:ABC-2 type transport system ATP-binding protein
LQANTSVTILFTTHNMEEAEPLCDEVAIMGTGTIVARGSPRQLMEASRTDTLAGVYLHYTGRQFNSAEPN